MQGQPSSTTVHRQSRWLLRRSIESLNINKRVASVVGFSCERALALIAKSVITNSVAKHVFGDRNRLGDSGARPWRRHQLGTAGRRLRYGCTLPSFAVEVKARFWARSFCRFAEAKWTRIAE
jgi:hypothetical protein